MIRKSSVPWFYQNQISEHISPEMQQHIRAKRLKAEQIITTFNGKGQVATCKILQNAKLEIIKIDQKLHQQELILALPYCELKTMNNIIIKATELGCSQIDIIHTEFSCSTGSHKRINSKNLDKWQILMQQACQQSENPFIPKITYNNQLEQHIKTSQNKKLFVLGFATNNHVIESVNPAVLYVGPEGGFSQKEADLFIAHRAICLNISNQVLKVETAAIAGLALLTHLSQALTPSINFKI